MSPKKEVFKLFGGIVSPSTYLSASAIEGVGFHFGQSAEDVILLRLFRGKTEGIYVDVGAFHPRKYSNTYILHTFFGWTGINIDASSDTIALFNKERPNDINVHSGIGATSYEAVYWKFKHPARNTISLENVDRQISKGDTEVVDKENINVRRLADVLDEYLPNKKVIDLLNIDIEGLDLEALESNDWEKYRPKVILIEDYRLQTHGLDKSLIFSFLKKNGYIFISHTFDTSVYVEKDFYSEQERELLSKDKKNEYLNNKLLFKEPELYKRTISLAKAHPEWAKRRDTMNAKLDSIIKEQKLKDSIRDKEIKISALQIELNKEELQSIESSIKISRWKEDILKTKQRYKKISLDYKKIKGRYNRIVESKTWRYSKHLRSVLYKIKNSITRKSDIN